MKFAGKKFELQKKSLMGGAIAFFESLSKFSLLGLANIATNNSNSGGKWNDDESKGNPRKQSSEMYDPFAAGEEGMGLMVVFFVEFAKCLLLSVGGIIFFVFILFFFQ
jgi:hypothetical protein